MNLSKAIKITVCADGFVSVRFGKLKPRLNGGLPCYSTDTLEEAKILIQKVCTLEVCSSKGGTTLEYQAPDWPVIQDFNQVFKLGDVFETAEKEAL